MISTSAPGRPAATTLDDDRPLAVALKAERALIGCMIEDPALVAEVLAAINPSDFAEPAHRDIAAVIATMAQELRHIDALTVFDATVALKSLAVEAAGGHRYVAELAAGVVSTACWPDYAAIVRRHALKRGATATAMNGIHRFADAGNDLPSVIGDVARELANLAEARGGTGPVPIAVAGDEALAAQADDTVQAIVRLPWTELQSMLGGLRPGQEIILAGRRSAGKTAAGLQIALAAAFDGLPVAIFTLEMTKAEIYERLLLMAYKLNLRDRDQNAVEKAMARLAELPIAIDDTASISIDEIVGRAEKVRRTIGRLGLVVVDYLQLLRPPPRVENRTRELEMMSRETKLAAKRLQAPLLMLAQLGRGADHDGRPRTSHLRGSSAIEQDADVVLLLDRPGLENIDPGEKRKANLIVAKQRNGPTGDVPLVFVDAEVSFRRPD